MAENETLDLGDVGSGKWRKLRDSIAAGKPAADVAREAMRCLFQTFKNLQKLCAEKNGIPLQQVLRAVAGGDGVGDELLGNAAYGRDYLQLFQLQSSAGQDERTVVENVVELTVDKYFDQIGHELIGTAFPDARAFCEFRQSVREEMDDGVSSLASQLATQPEKPVRVPRRSAAEKHEHQFELLTMTIGASDAR